MKIFFYSMLLFALVQVHAAEETTPSFDRYQIILDRKPFGAAPLPDQNTASSVPLPPSESFAKTIRMSALLELDDGEMKVGLIDLKDNESFFLTVGQVEKGVELVSADYEAEEAVLRKGSEMALIKLQSGEIQQITESDRQAKIRQRRKRPTYAERRRARRERRQQRKREQQARAAQAKPAEPKFTGEELRKHLEEYQMELIRQGLPPLPLPLTPEMDEQLVTEGVLPPQPTGEE